MFYSKIFVLVYVLQILSNDEYKSLDHRVLANPSPNPRLCPRNFNNNAKNKSNAKFGIHETDLPSTFPDFVALSYSTLYAQTIRPYLHHQLFQGT